MSTPKPWPLNARPTAEQMAEWLARCTDEERVEVCAWMLAAQDRATRCFEMNHDGWLAHAAGRPEPAVEAVLVECEHCRGMSRT